MGDNLKNKGVPAASGYQTGKIGDGDSGGNLFNSQF